MKKRIGAVILAAGTARRMGRQKLLLPLGGQPLLAHVLQAVLALAWKDCIAVIGEPEAELAALCGQYSIRTVVNPDRQTGQSSSVRLALSHLSNELDGILFLLGDQPLLSPLLLKALTERFSELGDNRSIVVPYFQGRRRNPVLFGSSWRSQLAALQGDQGGRELIEKNPQWVNRIVWEEEQSFLDADTWEDYELLKKISSLYPFG
ncbi:MAG: MobA-like transferase domain containing protein [Firmicutes bacterium]|nr:MobA-like transferase domain containing protein [Bacillota bacterium]